MSDTKEDVAFRIRCIREFSNGIPYDIRSVTYALCDYMLET